MSEQNRTAPRWEDAREHTLKLLREERDSLAAELPRIESIDERELFDAWLARVDLALTTIGAIDDAALARLAEPERVDVVRATLDACAHAEAVLADVRGRNGLPEQPTAAERWRAVPERARRIIVDDLTARAENEDGGAYALRYHPAASASRREVAEAVRTLLALAREAEGGGV